MASVPTTPKTPHGVKKASARSTPQSAVKRTINTFDANGSYIEEEDTTYVYNETLDDDDSEIEEILQEEIDLLGADENNNDGSIKKTDEGKSATKDDLKDDLKDELVTENTEDVKSNEIPQSILVQPTAFRQFIFDHEILRKLLHSSIGVFTMWLYTLGVHQTQLILPLSTMFVVIFANDYIRFKYPEINKKVVSHMWFLMRELEVNSYNGTLFYLIGLILVFSIMPKDISLMAVLLLSWADTSASTFGRAFGKYTPKIAKGKSLAGCIASFFSGVFSCYILYGYFIPAYGAKVNVPGDVMWSPNTSKLTFPVYAVLSGVVASVSECVDLFGIDDNFTIPVLSSVSLYALVKAFEA